jgi:hypothetical protein
MFFNGLNPVSPDNQECSVLLIGSNMKMRHHVFRFLIIFLTVGAILPREAAAGDGLVITSLSCSNGGPSPYQITGTAKPDGGTPCRNPHDAVCFYVDPNGKKSNDFPGSVDSKGNIRCTAYVTSGIPGRYHFAITVLCTSGPFAPGLPFGSAGADVSCS